MPLTCVFISPINKGVSYAIGEVSISYQGDTVTYIDGDFNNAKIHSVEQAYYFLDELKSDLGFDNSENAFNYIKTTETLTGRVYKFNQKVEGININGAELNINVTNSGKVSSIIGCYHKNVFVNNEINYSQEQAKELILNEKPDALVNYIETVIVLSENIGTINYVFEVQLEMETLKTFVSAKTLKITKELSSATSLRDSLPTSGYTIENVATTQTNYKNQKVTLNIDKYTSIDGLEYFYLLSDKDRKIYVTTGEHRDTYSGYKYYDSYYENGYISDKVAVQAYEYIMKCYDFYANKENFGISIEGVRNANNQVIDLIAIVHFGVNYENAACYVPSTNSKIGYFVFGDGNKSQGTDSFVQGLDVVGHEYQHSITDTIVMLEYLNESGAICEAYSDIFGAVIEGYELTDANFWRMGEDIYGGRDYFRDMSNPSATGCTYDYTNLAMPLCTKTGCSHSNCDRGGVHYNCTLLTYATYIMYQQNPEHFTKTNILKLWYQALSKLTSQATFIQFAQAMVDAAKDLGYTESQIRNIEFAFASVKIPGYTGVETWGENTLTYLQGSGTTAVPYLINSVADLASVAYYVNNNSDEGIYSNATYKLNIDIDLKNIDWIGIGTKDYPFNGTFNGGSHLISNLNITGQDGDEYAGLFRYTGEDSYIYDLYIGSGNVTTKAQYAGALVGQLKGSITGCSSALNIKGKNVGGIVGLAINQYGGKIITNSFSTADLDGEIVGGIVSIFASPLNMHYGQHFSGYVASCYTQGTLTGNIVGGLVGKANAIYVVNSISISSLIATETSSILGGMIGVLSNENPLSEGEDITVKVSSYILSSKSTSGFICETDTTVGLIIGTVLGEINQGNILLQNSVVKKRENYSLIGGTVPSNVKVELTKISEDSAFNGLFDFDNEKYYKNTKNWTILDGIEAFDLVSTFEIVENNKMPKFKSSEFWFNYYDFSFAGGDGSEDNPYKISSAKQLMLLARLLMTENYEEYATKYYKLVNDIDLAGKIWTGIGYTKHIIVEGATQSTTIYPFRGHFDGNGYTIYNMTSTGAYSVNPTNNSGTSYILYEFAPALFSVTTSVFSGLTMINPTFKNIQFEDVNIRGNNAATLVSKAYYGINIENVTVMGGNISSSAIAGGIVAKIDSISTALTSSLIQPVSNIINCYTLVNISGNVAGSVVGYVTNASSVNASTLNIINHLNRGTVSAIGDDLESIYSNGAYAYYKAIAGGLVGVTLIKNLNIINSINLADVVSYSENPLIGGLIGCVGVGDIYTQRNISINIDGCKQAGKIYFIFDNLINSAGSIMGGMHESLGASINLSINNKTFNKQNGVIVSNYNESLLTIDSSMQIVDDEVGEGAFAIYDDSYYNNSSYFNSSYFWTEAQRTRLYYKIIFKSYNNEINAFEVFDTIIVRDGESITLPAQTPSGYSTVQYNYTFAGWSNDLTNIDRNMTVYAEYDAEIRSYIVTYVDRDGNIINQLTLEYGSSVNQDIEAPQKESSFFLKYEFLRWGKEGQTVSGNVQVSPIYKASLTGSSVAIVFFLGIMIFAGIVTIASKKKVS